MWVERVGGGAVSASPVLAGGNIYSTNERGVTFVIKANPKQFELVSRNQLGNESFATPTFCGNQIFLRTAGNAGGRRQEYLYCLGK